ncbi:hypothetical protein [Variovorax terrae]|uniref:Uncharacterized protein n=1 Tax=Variovorax terrae TaxID=2923278 RepID=A0A9X1VVQ2_9BURK|nr:hypothetical protein [Variovorax terrae]MCJ0764636.1 hypothetical protein [Variovorax terrae]
MEMTFVAILFVLVVLLAIWASPGWSALVAQYRALFSVQPPGQVSPPDGRSAPPATAADPQHRHGGAPAGQHGPKRHTVVPHQARGR